MLHLTPATQYATSAVLFDKRDLIKDLVVHLAVQAKRLIFRPVWLAPLCKYMIYGSGIIQVCVQARDNLS